MIAMGRPPSDWQVRPTDRIRILLFCPYFMLAGAFVLLTQGHDVVSLFDAFWSERLPYKVAWIVLVFVPFTLLPPTVYLCDFLAWRRQVGSTVALQLDGMPISVKNPTKSQVKDETALHYLSYRSREYAVSTSRRWLSVLPFGGGAVRARQQSLRERHAPAVEANRPIERLLQELDGKAKDIERALDEIGNSDDAPFKDHLKQLKEFIAHCQKRCDEIELTSDKIEGLKGDYLKLRKRVASYVTARKTVSNDIRDLIEVRHSLATDMDSLLPMSSDTFTASFKALAEDNKKLDSDTSMQFSKLAKLRQDIETDIAPYIRPGRRQMPLSVVNTHF
jgi:hypothetical protein